MNQKLYMACAGFFSLAMLACTEFSNSPVTGTAEEPNVLTANNDLSSSGTLVNGSSSSIETPTSSAARTEQPNSDEHPTSPSGSEPSDLSSSSSEPHTLESSSSFRPVLCKTNGGPCGGDGGGDLWFPSYDYDTVHTDRYAEDKSVFGEKAGTWFLETDADNNGHSTIQWGNERVREDWDGKSLIPVIEDCQGLCGTFALDNEDLSYNAFVRVGFYVAGFDTNGVALSADLSNWQGICIAYYLSGASADLELSLGDSLDMAMEYAVLSAPLGENSGRSICYEWSRFQQPGWQSKNALSLSGEEAARRLVKVVIRIHGKSGLTGDFRIIGVGTNI